MVGLNRPYHFKFFKGCLTQILFGPFLNTLTQMRMKVAILLFSVADGVICGTCTNHVVEDDYNDNDNNNDEDYVVSLTQTIRFFVGLEHISCH